MTFSLMAYLSIENQAVIDKLQVVSDFPEVFSNEIPDVAPEREVEFSIDLLPRIDDLMDQLVGARVFSKMYLR